MTPSLLLASFWLAAAAGAGRWGAALDWPAAPAAALTGIPLLGWLTYQNGPLAGMVALAMGASVLLRVAAPARFAK